MGGVWRMMNFRQRMGWIGVGLYLLASVAVVYYVFEIDQTYNRLTLEHVERVAQEQQPLAGDNAPTTASSGPPSSSPPQPRCPPGPRVFLFLYSCTRADPKTVGYCILPICLAVLCNRHQTFAKASNQISRLQLIDT
ncbi:unnamed protein product [Coregonus sp. 'balchen']|nr:unnamed protein product [Coregonus sp. 'balchen']